MQHDVVFGYICLAIGAALVAVQVRLLWAASKDGPTSETRQRVRRSADAASSAATMAEEATLVAERAVQQASDLASEANLGAEGLSSIQQRADNALESTASARRQAQEAKAKAEEASKAAQGSTINDVLSSIAGKAPMGVLGLLFAVLGAMSMGLIDLSIGAGAAT